MGNNALTRRGLLSLGLALPLAASGEEAGSRAFQPPLYAVDPLSGLALHGYDAVSYALGERPLPGRADHESVWAGLTWRFAGPANRVAFTRDPEAYAPRLGGFDPLGIAEGRLVDADPLVALHRDGRLYLFRSEARRAAADAPLIAAAEARWPALRRHLGG
ncbi:YHS domain-containing (seleno)protein [Methylobacterium sp. ID0610]|uniref:YHS domain-containing (seleno)protein n=1 Tax=Methylobacterium carpenticola TaxID=3344827 RepID=UPI0036AFA569